MFLLYKRKQILTCLFKTNDSPSVLNIPLINVGSSSVSDPMEF